ncbi:NlpC/P60 family protein [Lactiplantibacillus sp. WILCCON 0030]|uniref:NlpC/P60 family protein n=1 Tax=Lactiplantibacillus brownii TaxID=3069269 RepID=A0ABU1ACG0_9LACO|nr:NlpC/P60 family protein [Lactiplantibacillus brownii]MDQ7938591.1 NlpC/P60 family protein [Lactiplantibacillus brownii]
MKVNIKQVMLGTAALAGLMVTSQAVANADSMTIKSGDTVWAYSQKYHVAINDIVKQNHLGSADLIIAGQKINIPGVKTSDNSKTTTTASASSVKSTSAATSTSSQATSAVATSSTVTSASSTSQAASSSSVASTSAAVQSSTSTASASSSVASSAASTSQSSSVVSQASQSSVASQSSTSQSAVTSQSSNTTSYSSQNTSSQSTSSQSSNSTASQSSTRTTATAYRAASTTTRSASTSTAVSASSAISAAYTLVGTPYEQLDCSAFTQKAFAMAGRQIGRTTYAQATIGSHVSFGQAQAGDLVFWGSDSAPYHVAIYLGGGQYIGAHDYGDPASVKSTAYYTPSFAIHM